MDLQLSEPVYLVTGGGRDLGRATADLLVAEGARVQLSGRSEETLDAAVDELGGNAVAATGDAQAARQKTIAAIPLGRYGRPEEFAAAAAFLSAASSFVTGVMLPVDGGMLRAL